MASCIQIYENITLPRRNQHCRKINILIQITAASLFDLDMQQATVLGANSKYQCEENNHWEKS